MAHFDPPGGLIPRSPFELTPTWLHDALVEAGLETPAIERIEFEELDIEVLTSTVVRLKPRYAGAPGSAPQSLIWKRAHPDHARRAAFAHGYAREVEFYREIAPTVDVSVPRCFVAAHDESTSAQVLLLEDLTPAKRGDFLEGVDHERALGVVRELGRLHAARWSGSAPKTVDELDRYRAFVAQWTDASEQYLTRHVDDRVGERNERYQLGVVGWLGALAELPQTLCHADAHAANVLFPLSPSERPFLVDWQGWRIDAGIRDVVRFVVLGLAAERRRAHEGEIVAAYLDELRSRGVRYDGRDAERDYRVASTLQWGWAVGFFRHEPIWDAGTREAMPELVRRAAAAFDDAVDWLDGHPAKL